MNIYQELPALQENHVRLLQVTTLSGASCDVRCDLDVVALSDRPDYSALSYTWGSPYAGYYDREKMEKKDQELKERHGNGENTMDQHEVPETFGKRIICNGKELPVTSNLYDFLVRYSQGPEQTLHQRLWIDAICINQTDLLERSHQVNIMAEIYKAASHIVLWLGEEEEFTLLAFKLIEALKALPPTERSKILPHRVLKLSTNLLLDLSHWQALARLFERTWFSRAWIIQEVVFARRIEVLCGACTVSWEDLTMVSQFLATSIWNNSFKDSGSFISTDSAGVRWHTIPARLAATKKTWSTGSSDGLLYALIRGRSSICQDPKDKVYSQLRLGHAAISPNYTLSVAEVYINTAKYILQQADNLLLLTCIEGEEFQTVPGLPSWVPDWSVAKPLGLRVTGYGSFTASSARARRYSLKVRDGKHLLAVEATLIDDIVESGETKKELLHLHNAPAFWAMISRLDEKYVTGESRDEIIWRTLITNREAISEPLSVKYPASTDLESSFRSWICWRYAVDSNAPSEFPICTSADSILPSREEILQTITNCRESPDSLPSLAHRAYPFDVQYSPAMLQRPFRTKQGFFGLGTQTLRKDDSVWIVSGCRVPLILRNVENSYRLRVVGGSYVHGFMNGEALRNKKAKFQMVELE
jgi:hypothetical protein